jgi:trk system potassium uptake protein TrkA
MAKRLDSNILTIASITNPDFILDDDTAEKLGVDIVISPELITAEKIYKLCVLENAIEYEKIQLFNVSMVLFEVPPDSELIGKVVINTFVPENCTVFGLYRNWVPELRCDIAEIHAGDIIGMIGSEKALEEYNQALGVKIISRDITVLGGTIVGKNICRLLSSDGRKRSIRIYDKDRDVCKELSEALTGVEIGHEDFTDPQMQVNENIFRSDCLVTVTNQDDTNLLMSMAATNAKTNKIISRYLKKEYMSIFAYTGLTAIVGFDRIVTNQISRCVMSDSKVILRLRDFDQQFFIHDVNKRSKLLGKYYGDLVMDKAVRIVAIKRQDKLIYPRMDTQFLEGDQAMVFTSKAKDKDLAKIFGRTVLTEGMADEF